jgi:hypothetical protein
MQGPSQWRCRPWKRGPDRLPWYRKVLGVPLRVDNRTVRLHLRKAGLRELVSGEFTVTHGAPITKAEAREGLRRGMFNPDPMDFGGLLFVLNYSPTTQAGPGGREG